MKYKNGIHRKLEFVTTMMNKISMDSLQFQSESTEIYHFFIIKTIVIMYYSLNIHV